MQELGLSVHLLNCPQTEDKKVGNPHLPSNGIDNDHYVAALDLFQGSFDHLER